MARNDELHDWSKFNINERAKQALEYFHGAGMIENTYGDQRYYTEILITFVADKLHVSLE